MSEKEANIEINMHSGTLKEIFINIAEHAKAENKEFKLMFNTVLHAKTFCCDGRLPKLEMPPVALIIFKLEDGYGLNYECLYNSNDSHAMLIPIETSGIKYLIENFGVIK